MRFSWNLYHKASQWISLWSLSLFWEQLFYGLPVRACKGKSRAKLWEWVFRVEEIVYRYKGGGYNRNYNKAGCKGGTD